MRAPDPRILTVLALAAVSGCAAQDAPEVRAAPPTALDAPVSGPHPAPTATKDEAPNSLDEDLGFAEYERLLADNESRLRAAGVLLAAREEARPSGGYAPPPPVGGLSSAKSAKHSDGASGAGGGAAEPTARPQLTTRSPAKRRSTPAPTPAPASPPAEVSEAEDAPAASCQTICDLSSATCDLEARICDLAARHANDPRYGELCRRADDDCRVAADACQRCSP